MQAVFNLFSDNSNIWLKGNTRTHTYCDGHRSLEEAIQRYCRTGYDLLLLAEQEDKAEDAKCSLTSHDYPPIVFWSCPG